MFRLDDVKKYYLFRCFNKRLAMPVWFLFMIDQGLSVQEIAIVAGISTIASFVLEIPSGSIADTIGHKRALILAALGQGLGLALFIGGGFWWILAGSLMYWSTGTLMTGTHEAFFFEKLVALKRKDEYQKLMGRARSVSSIFSAAAVATAGFLYVLHPSIPFIASAFIYWLGALTVVSFTANGNGVSVAKQEGLQAWISHFGTAWNTIRHHPPLFWLMGLNAIILGFDIAATDFQQIILDNIGMAAGLFGILYALKRVFSAAMAPLLHRLRPFLTPHRTLMIMFSASSIYFLLMGRISNHAAIFIIVLLASLTLVINDILISDYKNRMIPSGSRATTLSMGNFLEASVRFICISLIGAMAIVASLEDIHFFMGVFLAMLGVVLLTRARTVFRLPSSTERLPQT